MLSMEALNSSAYYFLTLRSVVLGNTSLSYLILVTDLWPFSLISIGIYIKLISLLEQELLYQIKQILL
jgi:hypothetical protein